MFFKNYFQQTKSSLYSFIYILPLFIIYELGISLISSDGLPTVRNGAEVLIRNSFSHLGISGLYGVAIILLIGAIAIFITNRKKFSGLKLKGNYFIFMLFESLFWAVILDLFLSQGQLLLSKESSSILIQQVILSVGSGLFEEFIFRVLLIGAIILILRIFIKKNYWYKMTIAIFIAAIFFSYFHFIGEFANDWELNLFLIRFLAGLFLGYLYALRGFGIVAYAHSFYNLIILSQLSVNH